jgi:putative intracellular protease/amidase
MAATLVTEALRWAATGALVGLVAHQWLWPWAQRVTPPVVGWLWSFLVGAGPIAVTCVGLGILAGADLRNADTSRSPSLELTGSVAGGFVGFVGASYFELAKPLMLPNGWTIGVPILAGATVAGLIGALTAVFKPRADAQREQKSRAEQAKLVLFERSVMRLRQLGYEVRYVERQGFRIRRAMLDTMLAIYLEKADAKVRAGVKRAVYECSFDEFVQRVAVKVSAEEEPEQREVKRQEIVDEIYAHPYYQMMKNVYEFFRAGSHSRLPDPPYTLVDTNQREFRVTSVDALAAYIDDLSQSAGSAPQSNALTTQNLQVWR